MVLGLQHVVIKRRQEHKTLKVGSILWITGTLTPYARVDGYYFGSVTKPDYIVRLFPQFQFLLDDPHVSFMKEFAEHIDEEDLYKRFHDPQEFDFFDEEKEEVIDCDSTTTKMSSEEENRNKMVPGMTLIYQHFRSSPSLGAQGSTGQNDFHQLETYQQNQFGIGPNLVPSQTNQHIQMDTVPPPNQQVFHPGPSSYRGRGAQHTRARGRRRKRSMRKYNKPM